MVIDLKLIELNTVVRDNALWVTEQIPGLVVADDLTEILRAGGNFTVLPLLKCSEGCVA